MPLLRGAYYNIEPSQRTYVVSIFKNLPQKNDLYLIFIYYFRILILFLLQTMILD